MTGTKTFQLNAIIFDIDGVLIDVRSSYREGIKHVVREFSPDGEEVSNETIEKYKGKGGFNDDWRLTEAILQARDIVISFETIKQTFEEVFLGAATFEKFYGKEPERINREVGLVDSEQLLVKPETLDALRDRSISLGIATGRNLQESIYSLEKFGIRDRFDSLVTMDDTPEPLRKPHPHSLLEALRRISLDPEMKAGYIGDIPDDIRTAVEAGKERNFLAFGCTATAGDPEDYRNRFIDLGASAVLNDPNEILEIVTGTD